MEQNRLTLNIRHSALHNPEAAIQWLRDTRPAGVVVELVSTNDMEAAMRYRQALPKSSTVVIRIKDGEDGAYWEIGPHYMAPANFLNRYGAFGKNGLTLQVLCEPSFGGDPVKRSLMVSWMVEVVSLATFLGISLCVYNAATGNPSANNQLTWEGFEDLIVAINRDPQHMLGVHFYRRWGVPLEWMDSVGPLIAFCKARGIPVCPVVGTEHGLEDRGGEGDSGWSGPLWHMTEWEYVQTLHEDYRNLWEDYVEQGVLKWIALFAASDNGWNSFNVMPVLDELKSAIEDGWFVTAAAEIPAPPLFFTFTADVRVKFSAATTRLLLRKEPSVNSFEVGRLIQGDYRNVYITSKFWDEDRKWFWYQATFDGVTGWFAGITGVTVTPVIPIPPVEEPLPPPVDYKALYEKAQQEFDAFSKAVTELSNKLNEIIDNQ